MRIYFYLLTTGHRVNRILTFFLLDLCLGNAKRNAILDHNNICIQSGK